MYTPSILVLIVTWNKKQYVLDLLASLMTLNYPQTALDIVVVDNASEDGTVTAISTTYPHVHVLQNAENLGGTGGFNRGLAYAFTQPPERYRYLWLLDNDVLVHQQALLELVTLLEAKPDIAVAGSTMMQLDYPWRINEMGAFVNRGTGHLVLNRHLEEIPLWRGQPLDNLLKTKIDLSQELVNCQPYIDVDYVAAASLLVRADVARQAGLWRDYFLHFDDVEWCLRIARMRHRVVVSAKSLIWHLSAVAKVPTWVLYYDNRNVLDLLKTHGADKRTLRLLTRAVFRRAVYYQLIGKPDLAELHHFAVADFQTNRFGKREIQLTHTYQKIDKILSILLNPSVKRILLSWTVNLQAVKLQEPLIQALLQRQDLQITCLTQPGGTPVFQLPNAQFVYIPKNTLRWKYYWQLRGHYDLVIQSDYEASLGLSWLKADLLFVNTEGFCYRPAPQFRAVWQAALKWLRQFFN